MSTRRPWLLTAGCVLIAANLRPGITSAGPLLDEIRDATGMSAIVAGLLTTLPLVAFGLVSPLAPVIGRRVGIERTLLVAMGVLGLGLLVRSTGPTAVVLGGTAVVGTAMAFGNVLLPAVIKQDFPERAGVMMAVYSTTLAGTAGIAAGVTVPLADGAGLGWRGALAVWAALAAAAVIVWAPQARRTSGIVARGDGAPARIVPRLRGSTLAWSVTAFMGLQSLVFYSLVTWLPTLLRDHGMSASTAGWMLALMQIVSLVSTVVVPVAAMRRGEQRALVAVSALTLLAGLIGLDALGTGAAVLWVSLLGLGSGALFSLALTFLILRAADAPHAAALSGMAQSVGYLLAAIGPIGLGLLHDAGNGWGLPLVALSVVTAAGCLVGMRAAADRKVGGDGELQTVGGGAVGSRSRSSR
jgi:CP family cyanate transporter-like MFS transporter